MKSLALMFSALTVISLQTFANQDEIVTDIPKPTKSRSSCSELVKVGEAQVLGSVRALRKTPGSCALLLKTADLSVRNAFTNKADVTVFDLSVVGVEIGVDYDHSCDTRGMNSLYEVTHVVMKFQKVCTRFDSSGDRLSDEVTTVLRLDR